MASYHFAVQVRGRAAKANAVTAAAYRARTQLKDEQAGRLTKDYGEKGGFQRAEILAPEGAAAFLRDREKLWNHVEAMEKRCDAQLFREINMALPHELTDEERFALVRTFVTEHFTSRGMVADVAWHAPVPEQGDDRRNFHAHVMLTLRKATPTGLYRTKTREWNSKELVEAWRAAWSLHQNRFLEARGHKARVDHRSLTAQREDAVARGDRRAAVRLDRAPEIHVGATSRQMAAYSRVPPSADRQVNLPKQPRRKLGLERGPALDPWERHAPGTNTKPERLMWKKKARPRRTPEGEGRVLTRDEAARAVRVVRYSDFDRGSRVDWLTSLLAGNAERTKARQGKAEYQIARLQRKMFYWERQLDSWSRQADFAIDGAVRGGFFRWQRAQKANEERKAREEAERKKAHAAKRVNLVKLLMGELELVFTAARGGRSAVLARQQELIKWTKEPERRQERDQERGRARTRER